MRYTSAQSGFSLVELLVVVAIIALLAALVLPGLSRAREYAYFTSCKSSQRQIGVAFLIYAADNTGRIPCTDNFCDPNDSQSDGPHLKIGASGDIRGAYAHKTLMEKIYWRETRWQDGWDWEGDSNYGYLGRARDPGLYLPVEILWDPIAKVRGWGRYGTSSTYDYWTDSEVSRDVLTRRFSGVIGYSLAVRQVNCARYQNNSFKGHLLKGFYSGGASSLYAEGPNHRPDTRYRTITTSAAPSAWVAMCGTPCRDDSRNQLFRTHFGYAQATIGGFRFNVLHLDGHIDDSIWRELVCDLNQYLIYNVGTGGMKRRPYGWVSKSNPDQGLKATPEFEGAFDQNAGEFRTVSRAW